MNALITIDLTEYERMQARLGLLNEIQGIRQDTEKPSKLGTVSASGAWFHVLEVLNRDITAKEGPA